MLVSLLSTPSIARTLAEIVGRPMDAVMPIEMGGHNGLVPMLAEVLIALVIAVIAVMHAKGIVFAACAAVGVHHA